MWINEAYCAVHENEARFVFHPVYLPEITRIANINPEGSRHMSPLFFAQQHAFSTDYVIVDATSCATAAQDFADEHVHNSQWVDLNSQMASINSSAADGGRHPLPTLAEFAKVLGQMGITPQSHVLVYDRFNNINAAARFWWMLSAMGHDKVQVIDGGLAAIKAAKWPVDNLAVKVQACADYPVPATWQLPIASLDEVKTASVDETITIIDVRSAERYAGLAEPLDIVAGHIPAAVNMPLTEHVDKNGQLLPAAALQERYGHLAVDSTIIHCGSGVTACHTLLAMATANLPLPKLFVGSWSEWCNNDLPMVTNK